jgi:uncharacterized protein (TIGR04255 family)
VRLQIVNEPMPPRVWFVSESANELLQVQHDRLIYNWRKVKTEDVYPRYPYLRNRFLEDLQSFKGFLESETLGEFKPNQCEVTYVNQIEPCDVWSTHKDFGKVFAPWDASFSSPELPTLENIRMALQYVIEQPTADHIQPVGRLHVEVQPGIRVADQKPIFAMNLTARGSPLAEGDGLLGFLDLGREHIVRSFRALTTPAMHIEWGEHA